MLMEHVCQVATHDVQCKLLDEENLPIWDKFVEQHPQASVYHLSDWRYILNDVFGKRWHLIAALRDGKICAGLPLIHMKNWFFGNFLVSIPYMNYGGFLGQDDLLAEPIFQQAVALGRQLGVSHLELRHLQNHYPHLPVHTDKVSMWLSLPDSAEALFASFKSKLRSQIRKGEKNRLDVHIGGAELLSNFYTVYAQNMRDLGTPAYPQKLYQRILEAFPETARVVVITGQDTQPLAGGFLLGYRDRLEIPSAASLRRYNHLQSNMWFYWNCLKYACEQGYRPQTPAAASKRRSGHSRFCSAGHLNTFARRGPRRAPSPAS
jgi:FemAB-related protein (PEP-CTERM system-associated)